MLMAPYPPAEIPIKRVRFTLGADRVIRRQEWNHFLEDVVFEPAVAAVDEQGMLFCGSGAGVPKIPSGAATTTGGIVRTGSGRSRVVSRSEWTK